MAEEMKSNPEVQAAQLPDNPAAGEAQQPLPEEASVPDTTAAQATQIPTDNTPDPQAANPAVNADAAAQKQSGPEAATDAAAEGAKAKAKPAAAPKAKADSGDGGSAPAKGAAKKEKKPAVEDKPFAEFIQQDYLPALEAAFAKQNIQDLQLSFTDNQVVGSWQQGQRQFQVYFPDADINGQRAFGWSSNGRTRSTIEPFLIDERKISLDLMVFGVIQRLNAQKWFGNN